MKIFRVMLLIGLLGLTGCVGLLAAAPLAAGIAEGVTKGAIEGISAVAHDPKRPELP